MKTPVTTLIDNTRGLKFTESPRWRDGRLQFGDALRWQIYRWDGNALQPLADLSAMTSFCLSDGLVDASDRMYVGDIGYNFFDPANKPVDTCVIACVEPDGRARVVADGLHFPNGMVITPDGRTLIVAETMGHRLKAFDILADGSLANRRVYAPLPDDAHPDGIALDAEGAVWLANPEGRHLFISTSDSHDPAQIAKAPSASVRLVEVAVPGAGIP